MGGYTTKGNGPALLTACIVCLVLTWVFSTVRVYTRAVLTKVWKIEDWLFIATQISFTIYAIVSLESTLHGNGQLNVDINPTDIPIAMQWFFVGEILYIVNALLMRLSIGFFILRITGTNKIYIMLIRGTMIVITVLSIADLFYTIFQCQPISYFWLQFSGLSGKCLPALQVQWVTIVYSAFAAVADILFGVLPICILWNLQMNRKAKIVVGMLLCVGIVAGLTVIIRIKYVVDVSLAQDFMFATANVSLWAMIEPAIGICCMSASTWRPLFKSLREKASYAGQPSGAGAKYFSSGSKSATGKRCSSFGGSRNHNGYVKSVDNKDMNSYEDTIALRSLATGPGRMGGSGRVSEGDDNTSSKGILTSTTVQITRHQRRDDVV